MSTRNKINSDDMDNSPLMHAYCTQNTIIIIIIILCLHSVHFWTVLCLGYLLLPYHYTNSKKYQINIHYSCRINIQLISLCTKIVFIVVAHNLYRNSINDVQILTITSCITIKISNILSMTIYIYSLHFVCGLKTILPWDETQTKFVIHNS